MKMVQETVDLIGLKEEINKSKKDLTYLMDIFQQNEKLMNGSVGFKQFEEDISFLKKEINSLRVINDKTINFLLLELESHLDKQKYSQMDYNIFNTDANHFKLILNNKNQEIKKANTKIEKLEKIIDSKDDKINYLANTLSQLNDESGKNINYLNLFHECDDLNDINKLDCLKNHILIKEEEINSLKKEISRIEDELYK